jgi:hypothetical protein
MYSQRMVRQILRLGLLVTLAALVLSACGGNKQQESKPRPLPEEPKALRPGTYRSEEFKPSLSFHVGKGWSSSPLEAEASDVLQIVRGQTAGLSFVNAEQVLVYKPTRTGPPNLVEAPEDMVGWFQQHPYLQTSKPEPVRVGGVKGLKFDVVVGELPQNYIPKCTSIAGTPNCVDLFRLSTGGEMLLVEGDKARAIVLEDVGGKTVGIGFSSSASEFKEFAPEAQKVLDSVEWRDS